MLPCMWGTVSEATCVHVRGVKEIKEESQDTQGVCTNTHKPRKKGAPHDTTPHHTPDPEGPKNARVGVGLDDSVSYVLALQLAGLSTSNTRGTRCVNSTPSVCNLGHCGPLAPNER